MYSIRDRFAALPAAERLRGVAALVATATIGHLVLLRIVPAHIAPALPKAFWLLIASAAIIVAVFADRFAARWPSSRLSGRLKSRR